MAALGYGAWHHAVALGLILCRAVHAQQPVLVGCELLNGESYTISKMVIVLVPMSLAATALPVMARRAQVQCALQAHAFRSSMARALLAAMVARVAGRST